MFLKSFSFVQIFVKPDFCVLSGGFWIFCVPDGLLPSMVQTQNFYMFMMVSNEVGLQKITVIGTWGKKYPNNFAFLISILENIISEKKNMSS